MKFLTKSTVWTNSELGLLKLCWISGGICLGFLLTPFVEKYLMYFLFVFGITALASLTLWIGKLKRKADRST